MIGLGYYASAKECKPYAIDARISVVDLHGLAKVCSVHNSVKLNLRSAFPDRHALPLTSSWAGTADRSLEYRVDAPNSRKVQKPTLAY